jgi:hypothetical protein
MKCVYIDFCGSVIEINFDAREVRYRCPSPRTTHGLHPHRYVSCDATLLEFRGGVGSLFLGALSTDSSTSNDARRVATGGDEDGRAGRMIGEMQLWPARYSWLLRSGWEFMFRRG